MSLVSAKIDDVCVVGDGAHASIKRVLEGIPYLTSKNFKIDGLDLTKLDFISKEDYYKHFNGKSKAITKPILNDVILSIIGSIGSPHLVKNNDEFGLSSSVCILRPNEDKILPVFLYYWLKSDFFQQSIHQIKSGVAQSFLSLGMIKSLPVNYFESLQTQKRIADILSAYDDLIENNLKRIKLLEQAAQNIYKEWFVNLRFPGHENTPINQEVGLPKGWEKVLAKEYFDFKRGIEVGSKNYVKEESENTIPFIRVGSIGSRDTDIFTDISLVKEKILKLSDVVVSMDGSIGIVGYGLVGAYSTGLRKVAAKSDKYGDGFIFCLLKSENIQNIIRAYAKGSTILHASSSIEHMSFNNAPSEIANQFNSIIEPMYNQMLNLNKLNQKLKSARDILLPRLMNRTIEV